MKYKIVVFDLDGTILNTLEDLADSTNYALSVFDMPERTIEEIRHFVGNGIRKLMERAVPQGTPESMIVNWSYLCASPGRHRNRNGPCRDRGRTCYRRI